MKIIAFLAIFLSLFSITFSFHHPLPVRSYMKKISNKEIKVIEPIKPDRKDTYSVIFLTGGNNFITNDIYNHFLNTLASYKFSIICVPSNFDDYEFLLDELNKKYKGIITLQHSSSTILSVKLSKLNKKVKNLIFLDPVDNRIFFEEYRKINNKINLENASNVLFLNAENSYKWSLKPLIIPFIPFLSLKPESFNFNEKCKVTTIKAKNFGHTDILDKKWGDFMHNSKICAGNQNRDFNYLNYYHKWLSKIIHYFSYYDASKITKTIKKNGIDYDINSYQ